MGEDPSISDLENINPKLFGSRYSLISLPFTVFREGFKLGMGMGWNGMEWGRSSWDG
jgi:hypothetical protein